VHTIFLKKKKKGEQTRIETIFNDNVINYKKEKILFK